MKICLNGHGALALETLLLLSYILQIESTILNSNACDTRCNRDNWRWRRWCLENCTLKTITIRFTTAYTKETTRVRKSTTFSKNFKPKPNWKKETPKPPTVTTTSTTGITTTTTPTTQPMTSTKGFNFIQTSTSSLISGKMKTNSYSKIDKNENKLEKLVEENISTQNIYFKLAGGLLAFCFVVFVIFFFLRSMKKPHRVSFVDNRVIVETTMNV